MSKCPFSPLKKQKCFNISLKKKQTNKTEFHLFREQVQGLDNP